MNLAAEKDAIVKLIYEEKDLFVIQAVKSLLENGHHDEGDINTALKNELDASIKEADDGKELPFEEVSAELRKKYAA